MPDAAAPIASYRRRVAAGPDRVWENVLDWEHLPALHHEAFCAIECEDAGRWGWRAWAALPPADTPTRIQIELRIDWDDSSYHTRTLAGPGAGADIFTRVTPVDACHTDVQVDFFVPGIAGDKARKLGEAYVRLYTQLWDQDEEMMQGRQAFLDAGAAALPPRGTSGSLALGSLDEVRARLPYLVELEGHRYRIAEHAGELVAHTTVCPHLGGPLDAAELSEGAVVCPWHGYRFDLASGRGPDEQRCRLAVTARIATDGESGDVRLVVE
jgi:nitrite reductase/ring-hydroxylating ferredoxin subunit